MTSPRMMVVKQNLLSNLNPYRSWWKNKNVVHGGSSAKEIFTLFRSNKKCLFISLYHLYLSFIFSDLQTLRWISKINITQWQSTYGYLGSYLGWDPSAYQYGMLTYENVSVDSKESSAGIFPLTQNLNTKSNNLYLLFFSKFWIFFTLPHGKELWNFFFEISGNFGEK